VTKSKRPTIGSVICRDLTVEAADTVQRFHREVIGWKCLPHNMGDYRDGDVRPADEARDAS